MKKGLKWIALVVGILFILALAVACTSAPAADDTKADDTKADDAAADTSAEFFGVRDKSQEYYIITYASGAVYFTYIQQVWEELAEKLGVTGIFTGVTGADLTEMSQVFDQVVAKGACGIYTACPDADGCVEMINKAVEAGVPVVTFEADSPNSKRYCFLGNEAYDVGAQVAHSLAEAINEEGQVCVVTDLGPLQHMERVRGFRETLASDYPNVICGDADVLNGEVSTELAAELTTAFLQAHPDTVGIYSGFAEMSIGILTALNDLGLTGKIKVVGLGEDETTCLAVKNGEITASLTQSRYNETYWGLMMLYALHNGYVGEMENWEEAGAAILPLQVVPGFSMMTQDNVDYYIDTYFGGPID